jgi:acetylornithine deacetylase/succinyl-diaminopimelate desuccinylase-like protein
MEVQRALDFARRNRGRFLEELAAFVRHPSVSAAPRHAPDVARCAVWLADRLREAGLERVRVVRTKRHPIVMGQWRRRAGQPTLLVYGHYDVQPTAPVAAWRTPPFAPTVRGANLYGRGASDDKGQLFAHVKAIESCLRGAGALPVNVECVFEGEEEIGSPNLKPMIESGALDLKPDAVVVSDMAMAGPRRPAITYATRGNLSLELEVLGPGHDLHSGAYGGAIHNPLQALCEIIAKFHDGQGRIAIPGLYGRVLKLSDAERRRMRRFGPSDAKLLQDAKSVRGWGDLRFSAYERVTARPALTVNGLSGGYSGPASKGVIPSRALAKLSFRLVRDQNPGEIEGLFRTFIERITPPTVRSIVRTISRAAPTSIEMDNLVIRAAAEALGGAFGAFPTLVRSGGTIPVVDLFQKTFDAPVALFGFGQRDDGMHAPNEKFHLPTFFKAIEASILFMSLLRKEGAAEIAVTQCDRSFEGGGVCETRLRKWL